MSIPFKVDFLGKKTPAWLCDLNNSLWNILDGKNFVTEYISEGNKLILQTVKLSNELEQVVTTLLKNDIPQNIIVEYDPFPLDYTRIAYLSNYRQTAYIDPLLNAYSMSWDMVFSAHSRNTGPWPGSGCYTRDGWNAAIITGTTAESDPPKDACLYISMFGGKSLKENRAYSGMEINRAGVDLQKKIAYLNDKQTELTKFPDGSASFFLLAMYHSNGWLSEDDKLFSFSARDKEGKPLRRFVPVVDEAGEACLYDMVTKQPFRNSGSGAFTAGIDTLKQLQSLIKNLPDLTGQTADTLRICLGNDLRTEEVRAMINTSALAKNWQIIEPI